MQCTECGSTDMAFLAIANDGSGIVQCLNCNAEYDFISPNNVEGIDYLETRSTTTLIKGMTPAIIGGVLTAYIVGGFPSESDTPTERGHKKQVLVASIVASSFVGLVATLVAG